MRSARGPQTPPGSSRRSLPPSQLLQQRPGPFREADGLLGRLGLGWERAAEGPAVAALTGKEPHNPQVRKPRGRRRVGKEEPERAGTQPSLFIDLLPSAPSSWARRAEQFLDRSTREKQGAAAQQPEGGASSQGPVLPGRLCRGVPPPPQ